MLTSISSPQSYRYQSNSNQQSALTKNAADPSVTENPSTTSNKTAQNKINGLTPTQLQQIEKLKARDREVRAHEQAHLSAAGNIAKSGASYTYQQGPDGNRYAVGGEVNIDTSPIAGNPQATINKAEMIRRAALAPAQPSDQDRRVAAATATMITKAQLELQQQNKADQFKNQKTVNPNLGLNIDYSV